MFTGRLGNANARLGNFILAFGGVRFALHYISDGSQVIVVGTAEYQIAESEAIFEIIIGKSDEEVIDKINQSACEINEKLKRINKLKNKTGNQGEAQIITGKGGDDCKVEKSSSSIEERLKRLKRLRRKEGK